MNWVENSAAHRCVHFRDSAQQLALSNKRVSGLPCSATEDFGKIWFHERALERKPSLETETAYDRGFIRGPVINPLYSAVILGSHDIGGR